MIELLARIHNAQAQLLEELEHEASTEEVAARAEMSVARVLEVLELVKPSTSLALPVGEDDSGVASLKDMLEDGRSTPDEVLDEVMLRKDLISILQDLTPREAQVVKLRYGLGGEEETTLGDIGDRFSLTRERIRQIEGKAVRKLRLKQKEASGIMREYSEMTAAADKGMTTRQSKGTKKT